mmetsp:Transcript_17792/g.62768  ORF Transcript_17792/g.62768 Transcript_17792/m.62768 type:complete len:339 (-) Transcript_17792:83-1099(-)
MAIVISNRALRRLVLAMVAYWLAKKLYNRAVNGARRVRGKRVLVTGGAGGIGIEAARAFAKAGAAAVVLWDVNREALAEAEAKLREEFGPRCEVHGYAVDLSKRESVYEVAERVKVEVGTIDVLVNNAGIVSGASLLDLPDAKIVKTFEVNTISHFWTVKAFLPGMIEAGGGHIVTVASVAGVFAAPNLTDYCASKFAARGFTEALRLELIKNKSNVRVSCVCPGHVDTGLFKGFKTLLPTLSPSYVARRILQVVMDDQPLAYLPWLVYAAAHAQTILPIWVGDILNKFMGVTTCMDGFVSTKADETFSHMRVSPGGEGSGSSEESWTRVSPTRGHDA